MLRCRWRWIRLGLIVAVLTPGLLWALAVALAPTEWARNHVVGALEKSSGRSVRLEHLKLCPLGGIELTKLKIGAPKSVDDPWLEADRIQIDVSPFHLLIGKVQPSFLEVEGAKLRILRREDGSLELADLVQADARPSESGATEPHSCGLERCHAAVKRSQVVLIDQPSKSQITLDELQGDAVWEADGAARATLNGFMNQGSFQCAVHLDRTAGTPSFEGQFRANDVALDQGMNALKYVVPVFVGESARLDGRMTMDMYLRGRGKEKKALFQSLVGRGVISLDPVTLDGTALVEKISQVLEIKGGNQIGSLKSDFQVRDGRIATDNCSLNLGQLPLKINGWTDFDGRLDYQMSVEGLGDHIPGRARELLGELDLDLKSLASLRLSGTTDQLDVTLNSRARRHTSSVDDLLSRDERDRLKSLGRRIRDKVWR